MRHLHSGRKLGVAPDHRRALLRSLSLALIEHESIRTTPARAKELRWFADRIITLGKRGDLSARRQIVRLLGSTQTQVPGQNRVREALDRVYTVLVPRFKTRNGGYTQLLRLAERRPGDNAEMCLFRYIPDEKDEKTSKSAPKAKKPTPKVSASEREKKSAKADVKDQPIEKKKKSKEKSDKE